MFTRILVPTDFSDGSEVALSYSITMAERFRASLHLLHVVEDPSVSLVTDTFVVDATPVLEALVGEAETRISQCVPAESQKRLQVTTAVVVGPTAATIVEEALKLGADLIVMGTHGRGRIAHLLMGSVAERVVRTASCPVLTVRYPGVARGHTTSAREHSTSPVT